MKSKYIVAALLSVIMLFSSVPVHAAESTSDPIIWDGTVTLDIPSSLALYKSGINGYSTNTGTYIVPDFAVVDYSGNINTLIDIKSNQVGTYLNGSLQKRVTFNIGNPNNGSFSYINVNAEPIIMDDLFITLRLVKREANSTTVDINIQFDNYFLSNENIVLPLLINIDAVCSYDFTTNKSIYHQFWATRTVVDDYTGDVFAYSSILDVPSTDGQFAQQNQEIIENTTIQNELQEQANILQENANQLQQNENQILVDNHNNMINGFDDSAGDAINNDFSQAASDLEVAEDNLFQLASIDIDYDSYKDFFALTSVEGAIAFVSSWMQSVYQSMGIFRMPMLIGLIMLVVSRIIGYQNFSSGGG